MQYPDQLSGLKERRNIFFVKIRNESNLTLFQRRRGTLSREEQPGDAPTNGPKDAARYRDGLLQVR